MSAAAVIERARNLGVSLRVEGDRIKAKGPAPAVEEILPSLREYKPELLAALSASLPGVGEESGHWLIIEPPSKTEYWFSPAITRSELESRYSGAVLVALPEITSDLEQRKLTPAELDELAKLIPLVAERYACPPEEIAEMKMAAARDPSGALESFRALARQLGINYIDTEPERFLTAAQMTLSTKT